MTADSKKRCRAKLSMSAAIVLGCAVVTTSAFCQGAADRASARTDMTRATTEGRYQRLDQNRPAGVETIVREEVITVPVKKRLPRSSSAKSGSPPGARGLVATEPAGAAAAQSGEKVQYTTKRVVVRRTETVKQTPALRINPY